MHQSISLLHHDANAAWGAHAARVQMPVRARPVAASPARTFTFPIQHFNDPLAKAVGV